MYLAVFTSIAALATILGLGYLLYKRKVTGRIYVLLIVSLIFVAASGALWAKTVHITTENKKLLEGRQHAAHLISKWPKKDRFNFVSAVEFRGIVIAGMACFEAYQTEFPETYKTVKQLMLDKLQVSHNEDYNHISERKKLQEAAEVIVTTIESIKIYEKNT